jgi:hypothetical protein
MTGENCTSGCRTKDHATWGECMRSKRMLVGAMDPGHVKKWDGELYDYRDLRAQGIQPAGTTRMHIEAAKEISDNMGRPYNADELSPTEAVKNDRIERHTGKPIEEVLSV